MYKIGDLSTFCNEFRALLGAKSCVLIRRNFWHQAVLGTRCKRYSNCRFRKVKKNRKIAENGHIL